MNPFREDFYDPLPLKEQRHNAMLDQYLEEEKASQRLSREVETIRKNARLSCQAQQDQLRTLPTARGAATYRK